MVDRWITAGNLDSRDIANPIFAAYDKEVHPNQIHILTTPVTEGQIKTTKPVLETLAEEDGREMEITIHESPENPSGFQEYASELFQDIGDSTVALDITGQPSKYGTLLFQQAVRDNVEADHVYHLDYLIHPDSLDAEFYPSLPQTAFNLTDILEDFGKERRDD